MEDDNLTPEDSDQAREAAPAQAQPPKRKNRRKRSIIIFVVVSLLNAGLLVLLWTQLLTPAQNSARGQAVDPLIGHAAPTFTLSALHSQPGKSTISLSDFKGKAVVLNIWASWCVPCNQEAPLLESAWQHAQVGKQNVVFLGIDFQDASSDALTFMQKYGINYPNVLDASGSVTINYGVAQVPESFFINQHGTVVSHVAMQLTAQTLQSNLKLIT